MQLDVSILLYSTTAICTMVEKNHHPATNNINLSSCYYLYNLQITTEVLNKKKTGASSCNKTVSLTQIKIISSSMCFMTINYTSY